MIVVTLMSLFIGLFHGQEKELYTCIYTAHMHMHAYLHLQTHMCVYMFYKSSAHINNSNLVHPIGSTLLFAFHYLYVPSSPLRTLAFNNFDTFTHL